MPLEKCQCASSGAPMVFQWLSSGLPIMQINTGSPLGHHWVLESASVVPVASQCTCGSSGLPVCSNYANEHWIATGTPLGARISQCGSCGIPVYVWLQWSSRVFQLCKLTLDHHWNTTGCQHQPVWFQWHSNVLVAPVVFQCGLSSGFPVYLQNLVWRSLGQVTSQHATPNVYNWYGESCLS